MGTYLQLQLHPQLHEHPERTCKSGICELLLLFEFELEFESESEI